MWGESRIDVWGSGIVQGSIGESRRVQGSICISRWKGSDETRGGEGVQLRYCGVCWGTDVCFQYGVCARTINTIGGHGVCGEGQYVRNSCMYMYDNAWCVRSNPSGFWVWPTRV